MNARLDRSTIAAIALVGAVGVMYPYLEVPWMADDREADPPQRGIEVRLATIEDLGTLLACEERRPKGEPDRHDLLRESTQDGHCLIAIRDRHVIGYLVRRPKVFFGRDFVDLLVVHPSHRRLGAGAALLRAAVETSETAQVFTSTNQSNVAMQSLLTSDGWTLSGVLDGLDEGDPELVYYLRWCETEDRRFV